MRLTMKKIALLTLGLLMVCNCAFATVYELGDLAVGEEFSRTYAVSVGSLSDKFNFSILESELTGYGESFFSVNKKGTVISNIDDFKIELYDSNNVFLNRAFDSDSFTANLLAGSYYLLASGMVTTQGGGAYTLSLSSAVPIPGAALLLGSALLGVVGIRRTRIV
ncbi:hypothetical protein DSECCO2_477340 [anaerobic digester metagenome]